MAFQTPVSHVSMPVGFSSPLGTDQSGSVEHATVRQLRPRDVGLIAVMTVAAMIIGSFKGGWPYGAILAAIALGECVALMANDRNVENV